MTFIVVRVVGRMNPESKIAEPHLHPSVPGSVNPFLSPDECVLFVVRIGGLEGKVEIPVCRQWGRKQNGVVGILFQVNGP